MPLIDYSKIDHAEMVEREQRALVLIKRLHCLEFALRMLPQYAGLTDEQQRASYLLWLSPGDAKALTRVYQTYLDTKELEAK